MTTLKMLGEEVLRQFSRYNPNSDRKLHEQEVRLYCIQALNQLLKTEYYSLHNKLGDGVPPHAVIATYEVDVVPATNPPKTLECTSALAEGFYQYWADGGGLAWSTPDDEFWLAPGIPDVVMMISYVGDYDFQIVVSNIQWPDGIDPEDIETYLNGRVNSSFFEFVGAPIPNKFLKQACSAFVVTATTITFTYNYFDALRDASSYLLTKIRETADTFADYIQNEQFEIVKEIASLTRISNCKEAFRSDNVDAIAFLPAHPINVHNGMGVWRVYNISDPNNPYIPLPSQQGSMAYNISHNGLKSYLQYRICYEWMGQNTIRFNKPATSLPNRVGIQLLVVDPAQIDDMEPLPIPADMEIQVITAVLQMVGALPAPDLVQDHNPNPKA